MTHDEFCDVVRRLTDTAPGRFTVTTVDLLQASEYVTTTLERIIDDPAASAHHQAAAGAALFGSTLALMVVAFARAMGIAHVPMPASPGGRQQ